MWARTRIVMMLAALSGLPAGAMADDMALRELQQAVDHAQRSLDGTASRLALLVAEYDAGALEEPSSTAAPAAGESVPAGAGKVPAAGGVVTRHQFTSDVAVREPVDRLERISAAAGRVFYFTELSGLEGQRIRHRWLYRGEVMAEVPFEVRGPRWRVKSSKNLLPEWQGEWTVEVVDEAGRVLARDRLQVDAPAG